MRNIRIVGITLYLTPGRDIGGLSREKRYTSVTKVVAAIARGITQDLPEEYY
jgi:hypothetical protein